MADTQDGAATARPARKKKTPHVPSDVSRQRVKLLVASDVPNERIWILIDCSERSFYRHYKRDIEIALTEQIALLNHRLMAMGMGVGGRKVDRGAMRACMYLLEKAEARLRRHHGLDSSERDVAAEVQATKPTILRPDEPTPENPVL